MTTHTVVIGSGVSGLTAAALLAKRGEKVTVVERFSRPGGALRRFSRKGVFFDVGFHYTGLLGEGEFLRALWDHLGVLAELIPLPFPETGCDRYTLAESGREVSVPYHRDAWLESLATAFPRERQGIDSYLETLFKSTDDNPFFNLDLPLDFSAFSPFAGKALGDYLPALTLDPELQAVLAAPAFLHGVPPRDVSLMVHAITARSYLNGAWGIENGGQGIVDAFLKILKRAGAEIITESPVTGILIDNGAVSGVETPHGPLKADRVIHTGPPVDLPGLVPEGIFRPAFNNRLKNLKNTVSMFIVFAESEALETLPDPWINRYRLPGGLDLLETDPQRPDDNALLMCAPGGRDEPAPNLSAQDGVILMRPAAWEESARFDRFQEGPRPPGYRDWKRRETDRLLQTAWKTFGAPVADLKPLASGSPLTFRDELHSPEGGVYGVQHRIDQIAPGAKTRLPGLWLSGQGTLMPGVVGASASALITVGKMTHLETLWNEVRQCA